MLDRRRLWIACLVFGCVGIGAWFALPAAGVVICFAVGLGALGGAVVGIRLHRPQAPVAWGLVAASTGLFTVADLLWSVAPEPLPTLVYFAAYPPMALGVVYLVRPRRAADALGVLTDATLGAAAFATVQGVVFVEPAVSRDGFTLGTIDYFYPVLDVFLLLILVRAGACGWRVRPYRLLAAGVAVMFVADQWWAITGGTSGAPLDPIWLASYVLTAAAALHPAMATLPITARGTERWLMSFRLVLIGTGLLVPPLLLAVIEGGQGDGTSLVVVAGATVTALLVVFRTGSLLRRSENLRLAERRARAEAEAARSGVLAQNHRLRSLDRVKDGVLASVSHEFRSPLTSIRGHLRLVSDQAGDRLDERQQRSLQVIDRSSARLVKLVEDVLLVARMRAGQFELETATVDVAELARDCVDAALPTAMARGVAVELRADDDVPPAGGDAERIFQVIDNLIANAIKFSAAGDTVIVSVEAGAGTVELEVADTGPGISPVDQMQLFEPFARGATASARHTPGTGLGLFIAKTIVDAHGGVIHIDSTVGQGTRARVGLPARVREPLAGETQAVPA